MPSIQISDVSTFKNSTWTKEKLFDPFSNDLVLAMDFELSADIANTPGVQVTVAFEIIEFHSNNVVYYNATVWNLPLTWQDDYAILGPLTPYDLGLVWNASDIFGLR